MKTTFGVTEQPAIKRWSIKMLRQVWRERLLRYYLRRGEIRRELQKNPAFRALSMRNKILRVRGRIEDRHWRGQSETILLEIPTESQPNSLVRMDLSLQL